MKRLTLLLMLIAASACTLTGCKKKPPGDPVSPTKNECGDGVKGSSEACDDGNRSSNDGCSADCKTIEVGYNCPTAGQPCIPNSGPNPDPVETEICGDGTKGANEECDDGNTDDTDGCSATCKIQAGYECPTPGQECRKIVAPATCGDGKINAPGEECDDGNTDDTDGCSATCKIKAGYECLTTGQVCTKRPVEFEGVANKCGNGVTESGNGESCDDGNRVGGDGCSATCKLETGFTCRDGFGCTFNQSNCGNGTVEAGEECDWGATNPNAKCMKNCKLALCGNGKLEKGEACDDGNFSDSDGCSSTCQLETGFTCDPAKGCRLATCGNGTKESKEECDDGEAQNVGGYGKCQYDCKKGPHCGDGYLYPSEEECDDGNNNDSDGCTSDCKVESGYTCIQPGVACQPILCGNGTRDTGEGCDDGNRTPGDGCSDNCYIEPGYVCNQPGNPCTARECGDGVKATGEECDDGNTTSGDGCNAQCKVEYGYYCPTPGVACKRPVCGDGVVNFPEVCDDGNSKSGDGCSNNCHQIESGYTCTTTGASCVHNAKCGNGVREGAEECDDHNKKNGDGCAANCTIENNHGCEEDASGLSTCQSSVCGNGKLEKGEECDDGNKNAGDGCSPVCTFEAAFKDCRFNAKGEKVCGPVCGDGLTVVGVEECDDGNNTAGDGCSPDCKVEPGFTCTDFSGSTPDKIYLPMTLRDFKNSYNREFNDHQSFGWAGLCDAKTTNLGNMTTASSPFKINTGYLQNKLDDDGKPVLAPNGACYARYYSNPPSLDRAKELFYYWYHDDQYGVPGGTNPYAKKYTYQLEFTKISEGKYQISPYPKGYNPSKRTEDNKFYNAFFPLDGRGWNDHATARFDGQQHNFLFTTEFGFFFKYEGKPATLEFKGDDDLWVFVNGHLALDLGGLRSGTPGTVNITAKSNATTGKKWDRNYELYEGGIYEMKVFHAERLPDESKYLLTLTGFLNAGKSECAVKCGDGNVAYGLEECDLGTSNSNTQTTGGRYDSACSTSCRLNPGWFCRGSHCTQVECGNNTVEGTEQCDDGAQNGTATSRCDSMCHLKTCGNGSVDAGEECDPSDPVEKNCTDRCTRPVCQNGITELSEQCDDGNNINNDGCTNACSLPRCGDGIVSLGEVCDDGINSGQYGSCTLDCQAPAGRCGDGTIQAGHEKCDDGPKNGKPGSTCSSTCTITKSCGDGVREADEACDDGNSVDSDGCSSNCTVEPGYFCTGEVGEKSTCTRLG